MLRLFRHAVRIIGLQTGEIHLQNRLEQQHIGRDCKEEDQRGHQTEEDEVDLAADRRAPCLGQAELPGRIGDQAVTGRASKHDAGESGVNEFGILFITAAFRDIRPDCIQQDLQRDRVDHDGGKAEDDQEAPNVNDRLALEHLPGKGPADEPFAEAKLGKSAGGQKRADALKHYALAHHRLDAFLHGNGAGQSVSDKAEDGRPCDLTGAIAIDNTEEYAQHVHANLGNTAEGRDHAAEQEHQKNRNCRMDHF